MMKTEVKAIYGLMVRYRSYRCQVCGHIQNIQTNHTGVCMDHCMGCSWRSAYKQDEYNYIAGTHRPFAYIGLTPLEEEHNVHSGKDWVEPRHYGVRCNQIEKPDLTRTNAINFAKQLSEECPDIVYEVMDGQSVIGHYINGVWTQTIV